MNEGLSRAGTLTLLALFFAWGHVSVMLDMAIPSIKSAFSLSYRDVMLVQSAFFLAYLFLSIPAGMLVSRLGFRLGAVIGLALMSAGSALFSAAAYAAHFAVMLVSVFGIASGICFLQVSANPLAAAMGGGRSAASNLTFAQAFNALGTAFGPVVASITFLSAAHAVQTHSLSAVGDLFVGIASRSSSWG